MSTDFIPAPSLPPPPPTLSINYPKASLASRNGLWKQQSSNQELESCPNTSAQTQEICGTLLEETISTPELESRKAYKYFLHMSGLGETESYIFISSYLPVTPVLQNGPRCGMVALAMASELANSKPVATEEIFQEAQVRGYSKQGEMFTVKDLEMLSAHFLACPVQHYQVDNTEKPQCLVSSLLKRNIALIPYDADKNFSPCNKKGHKAHWALITGFFTMLKLAEVPDWLKSHCEKDEEIHNLFRWTKETSESEAICKQAAELLNQNLENMYVYGHHGKSRYAGLWSLQKLLLSNDNLTEAGPDRTNEGYIIPPGDINVGLRSQFVIINRNHSL